MECGVSLSPPAASCMVLKFTNHGTTLTMCTKVLCDWSTADCRVFAVKIQFSIALENTVVMRQMRKIQVSGETEFSWGCKFKFSDSPTRGLSRGAQTQFSFVKIKSPQSEAVLRLNP